MASLNLNLESTTRTRPGSKAGSAAASDFDSGPSHWQNAMWPRARRAPFTGLQVKWHWHAASTLGGPRSQAPRPVNAGSAAAGPFVSGQKGAACAQLAPSRLIQPAWCLHGPCQWALGFVCWLGTVQWQSTRLPIGAWPAPIP